MMRTGENIFKRKDGRWEARYHKGRTASGKLLYGTRYLRVYSEAKAQMERAKQEYAETAHTVSSAAQASFEDCCDAWLPDDQPRLHASTYVKYQTVLEKHIKPYFGSCYPHEIQSPSVSAFSQYLRNERKLAPKTAKDILLILHSISNMYKNNFREKTEPIDIIYPK